MFAMKTFALAGAVSAGLLLAGPATASGAPLSPPVIQGTDNAGVVQVAQRKWYRNNNSRQWNNGRDWNGRGQWAGNWHHVHGWGHGRYYAWGGHEHYHNGYYGPFLGAYGYAAPYCGYGYGYGYGYNNCYPYAGYGGYGYGYGGSGVNLFFGF